MNPRFVAFPPPAVKASLCQPSDISTNYTLDTADTVELTKANSLNPFTTHFPQQHTPPPHEHPQQYKLPPKRPKYKRVFHLPVLSTHRRLIVIVVLINLTLLALGIALQWYQNLPAIAYLVISNITVTVLIRQQRVINLLFFLATCTKTRLPLRLRWMLGKIYHFGGLHSACAVSATVWLLLFTISATVLRSTNSPNAPSEMLLLLTFVIDALLLTIVVLALPTFRSRFHNTFEATHRFLGWTALFFVWLFTIFLIRDFKTPTQSLSQAFFTSVSPYLLIIITLSIISPWIYLRKVPVSITKPSNHAIVVSFEKGVLNAFPGSSSAISLAPLYEWHSFANICTPGKDGFRLIISRAGDWTSSVIDNPPSHFWVRGIPTAGVANMETLFHKVLYVATGSGIGPVLPHLLQSRVPSRLFWSTRTPEKTYGRELVEEILNVSADAVIHDTTLLGKPDMVHTSYRLCMESGAEAVIVISNQKLTRKVVYGMEARGIPAFGAIWDS
eukprot:TRINITY_DN97_c0_g1_i1.p1 TRINITY_DN97_c0_g1~~TRINITY_DN97_c0_g1_i1.p1  ORF type:complete len:501 (-),score=52.68 TRINITY_DN97_c0_g1_i1:897-2399(-)